MTILPEARSQDRPCVIDILPEELLVHVFVYLDMDSRLNVGLVCRGWRQLLVCSPLLWRELTFSVGGLVLRSKIGHKPWHQEKLSLFKKYSQDSIESLSINNTVYPPDFDWSFHRHLLDTSYPHLKRFVIENCRSVDKENIELLHSFMKRHENLVQIEIASLYGLTLNVPKYFGTVPDWNP